MPPQRRHRQKPEPVVFLSPAEQLQADMARFAAVTKAAEKAKRDRIAAEQKAHREAAEAAKLLKETADRLLREQKAHAKALAIAQADVARTIEELKAARTSRRNIPAAEAAWKQARARLITLETGAQPSWAPKPAPGPTDAMEPTPSSVEQTDAASEGAATTADSAA